nr:MAG TPA: hypothetical protein [Caudoviricetes sp.]
MSNYQSFLFSLMVVLQILLVCCSYTKEDFGEFATGVITISLLVLFASTLCG